jgi:hypothetical protein
MLYRPLILRTLVLIALLSCNYSRSQTIPTLVVTPRHEHNFEILKSWMQSDRVFATKTALQSAMENAFRAAQQNDYSTYIRWVGEFENQFQQLSDADQQRLLNFALQNFVRPESSEMTGCENCCRADCGLTACSIQCPGGTTPRCQCRFFWADCGCEPFGGNKCRPTPWRSCAFRVTSAPNASPKSCGTCAAACGGSIA